MSYSADIESVRGRAVRRARRGGPGAGFAGQWADP